MKNNRLVALLCCLFAFQTILLSQDTTTTTTNEEVIQKMSCEQQLNEAQALYDGGYLEAVPEALEGLKGCDENAKERAYRLLVKTYLLLENDKKADSLYVKLLYVNPLYKPDDTELKDLIFFSRFFRASPWFAISAKAGGWTAFYI